MTHFIAIKMHYDSRPRLPAHLKYTDQPSEQEYTHFLKLYREQGVGGNGFHECMNFRLVEGEPVRIYLPPTCHPSQGNANDDFVIFSFTYQGDQELASHIVGVHAGARIVCNELHGIERADVTQHPELEKLCYHAEAPAELTTYFNAPVAYDFREGRHTPKYVAWGNKLRYLDHTHARNIIDDALRQARQVRTAGLPEVASMVERQISVLETIRLRYCGAAAPRGHQPMSGSGEPFAVAGLPDREIGERGERYVYEMELRRVAELRRPESDVQWVSKADPASPFDIKTVREIDGDIVPFYLEVKSSASADEDNIYISDRQIRFQESNPGTSAVAIVRYEPCKADPTVREASIADLREEFGFEAIKYRLRKRPK
jgi:hypothetical protein